VLDVERCRLAGNQERNERQGPSPPGMMRRHGGWVAAISHTGPGMTKGWGVEAGSGRAQSEPVAESSLTPRRLGLERIPWLFPDAPDEIGVARRNSDEESQCYAASRINQLRNRPVRRAT
jgi:hypothetical protein